METPETKRARIGYKIVEGIVMKSGTPGNSSGGTRRAQSKTLYQITGLLIVLLLASGLVIFFLVGSAQRNQLEESKDKLINVEASDVATSFELMMQIKSSQLMDLVRKYGSTDSTQSFAETAQTILNQQFSEMQVFICNDLKSLVDSGALGLSYALNIAVGVSGMPFEPMLFAASDPSLVYHWNVPQYLIDAIEEGKPYLYMENGIPELGLEGEQLIAIDMVENNDLSAGIEGFTFLAANVGIKPMHDDIAAINDYYKKGRNKLVLILALSVFISILGVILISFFVLNYLLRKRITEPIEELTAAAGKVMEGILDVDVKEHPGSDFLVLEQAFKEMLDSLKMLFDRSMEDQ